MTRRGFALAVLALLGITLTVALTWTIGRLAGQHIGLASAPLSVSRGLAPSAGPAERPERAPTHGAVHGAETTNRRPLTGAPAVVLPATGPPATVLGPGTQAPVPAAGPPATTTVTQASAAPAISPARPASSSSGGGDNGNGPGDSGGGGGSGGGRSPHSGNGRDD